MKSFYFLLLFLINIVYLCYLSCASSATFLSSSPYVWVLPLSILRIVHRILKGRQPRLSLTWDFWSRIWFRKAFSFFWGTLFLSFLSSSLVWCPLLIFPSTCIFLFSERFDSFLIWRFFSFHYLTFSTSHYEHNTFFHEHLCFLWSSHFNVKEKSLPGTYTLLIQYLCTNQILFGN